MMFYRIDGNNQKKIKQIFAEVFIVILLFLLIYNPPLKTMSSGFTRYIFLFLIISLCELRCIRNFINSFAVNVSYIDQKSVVMRLFCYIMRFFAFILLYIFMAAFFNGLIENILGKEAEPAYFIGINVGLITFIIMVLEYVGVIKCAAFVTLALSRGIKISYSQSTLYSGTLVTYWFCLTLFFVGIAVFMNTNDFSLPGNMIKILMFIFPVAFMTVRYLRKKETAGFDEVLCLLSYAIALQALFIMLDWFIAPFSYFLQAVLDKNAMEMRASGITGLAGDGLSLIQALGAITSFQLFMFSNTVKNKWKFAVLFVLQVLSIAFVGRTGFVLVAVFIVVSLVFNRYRVANVFRLIKLLMVSGIACLVLYFVLVPPHIQAVMETRFFPWAFEFAYSLAEKGTLDTSSTTAIKEDMLFLPDSEKTILVGDGYFQDPANPQSNYMGSDSGYVRLIFFAGLIGSFLFYLYFVLMAAMMYKISRDRRRVAFIFSTMVTLFVAQIKFPFMTLGSIHLFLLLLFFCLLNEYATANCAVAKQKENVKCLC